MRALLLLLCFAGVSELEASGQVSSNQASGTSLGKARAKTNTTLRARPDANSPAIYQLQQGSALKTIGEKGAFVRVVAERGPAGWTPAESIEVLGPPAAEACPAAPDDGKKKSVGGPVSILDFNDLLKLQSQAERLAGMARELSAEDRAKLSKLPLGDYRTGEGSGVRIGGYLALKPEGPRVAGACSGRPADDWLLNITSDANTKEYQGLVARVSASRRNPKWTLEKLKTVSARQFPVLVTGVLFYDGEAIVNDDSANPIQGQLRRGWLWELRQVNSILVCTSGGACEPGSPKGWVPLDQVN